MAVTSSMYSRRELSTRGFPVSFTSLGGSGSGISSFFSSALCGFLPTG